MIDATHVAEFATFEEAQEALEKSPDPIPMIFGDKERLVPKRAIHIAHEDDV